MQRQKFCTSIGFLNDFVSVTGGCLTPTHLKCGPYFSSFTVLVFPNKPLAQHFRKYSQALSRQATCNKGTTCTLWASNTSTPKFATLNQTGLNYPKLLQSIQPPGILTYCTTVPLKLCFSIVLLPFVFCQAPQVLISNSLHEDKNFFAIRNSMKAPFRWAWTSQSRSEVPFCNLIHFFALLSPVS